jgi:hypothetical protein
LGLEKQTFPNTKGKYKNSSEKKEESTEQSKIPGLKEKTSDDNSLIVNDGNLLKDNSFPTGIEALDNFYCLLLLLTFCLQELNFLTVRLI